MAELSINELKDIVMQLATEKKFGTKPEEINVGEKMCLIHSEVAEAYEAYRHQNIDGKDGFKEELADIILRVLHMCGIFDVNIEEELLKKMEYNKTRVWDFKKINEKSTST
ncbi:MAG: hypothetical protein A3B90_00615 [Candidatus Magasanikbacteria bacterium RIFCSPHIGHO2_02_FULL_41_13]|uniref:NTP pyrophosphohydrolase MazG putative catalytic core domain-containing protein n=1 Tax=Candidatus Magasanikbacteria bacterium RIFCSPHIGHO2_02_FULL_41_13 TaxID=1798676 RepID=A0A1F6M6R9_9BACT|nr:MAG: hypothetical protein A3B90_00615 [Candidatus Magasanikbacteria bacterium RIFCSPHIGHO2_02_FULL_41_13]